MRALIGKSELIEFEFSFAPTLPWFISNQKVMCGKEKKIGSTHISQRRTTHEAQADIDEDVDRKRWRTVAMAIVVNLREESPNWLWDIIREGVRACLGGFDLEYLGLVFGFFWLRYWILDWLFILWDLESKRASLDGLWHPLIHGSVLIDFLPPLGTRRPNNKLILA